MDVVTLSESNSVIAALRDMLESAIGPHGYLLSRYADVPTALMVIEVAKRAPDREEWFPRGKWGTIQSMQAMTERELNLLFPQGKPPREIDAAMKSALPDELPQGEKND